MINQMRMWEVGGTDLLECCRSNPLDIGRNLESNLGIMRITLIITRILLVPIPTSIHRHTIVLTFRQFSTIRNRQSLGRSVVLDGCALDYSDDGTTGDDFSEDDVLAVEVGGSDCRDEELRSVRRGSRVGHREKEGLLVLEDEAGRTRRQQGAREGGQWREGTRFSSSNLSP